MHAACVGWSVKDCQPSDSAAHAASVNSSYFEYPGSARGPRDSTVRESGEGYMIEVRYQRNVPYPTARVLSQYFDLEHLEHVHPKTFGRARLLSQHGNSVVWELEWPSILGVAWFRSWFRQEHIPPFGIRSVIIKGLFRGTESEVRLTSSAQSTLVEELHRIALPDCQGPCWLVKK